MADKPDLTPEFCLKAVINSTPKPNRWDPQKDTPSAKTLFDLGVVSASESGVFVEAVKGRISPWKIHDNDVASAPATTLQAAANSVQNNAF
ncbi:MAG: hypothetical protein WBQ94_22220 [Terracidiphilus sp.]